MAVCTVLISGGAWVGVVGSDTLVIVLLGLMAMGTAAFMANYFSFTQEVSPRYTGLVVGILGGSATSSWPGSSPWPGGEGRLRELCADLRAGRAAPFVGLAALVLGWGNPPRGEESS